MNNKIRFTAIDSNGQQIHQTPWHNETSKDDALTVLTAMRKQLGGDYAYRIERTGDSKEANAIPMFRYSIHIHKGVVQVIDGDGTHMRKVSDATLQSRPFREDEREKVLSEIKAAFPDAQLTEVRV